MSTDKKASLKQGMHILKLIADQEATFEDLKKLSDGYLTDVLKAISRAVILGPVGFRRQIGMCGIVDYRITVQETHATLGYSGNVPGDFYRCDSPKKVEVEWRIVPFTFCGDREFWALQTDGWQFARPIELFAYGAQSFQDIPILIAMGAGTGNCGQFWAISVKGNVKTTYVVSDTYFKKTPCLMFRPLDYHK